MNNGSTNRPTYSFVIPVYNEEETLPKLHQTISEIMDRMDGDSEIIFIDNNSSDNSYSLMVDYSRNDPRFKVIHFSRDFGNQIAVTAGLDYSVGQAVIVMDADLQDPPEVVLEMAKRWREGFDVVYGIREKRSGETWFKRATASIFYRILGKLSQTKIPADVGDFRLADRKAINAIKAMRERSRFLRGMFAWIGFKQTGVYFHRAERFAGKTKYPLRKMVRLAVDGVLSFSNLPLRIALAFGSIVAGLSFALGITAIILKVSGVYAVSGWASLVVIVLFLGGMQLTVIGIVGEYLARMYDEVKRRPLYIVGETHGFGENAGTGSVGDR